jgi:hypothetical protein
MLAVKGSEPTLTAAAGNAPLLDPGQVVLFAHAMSHSTRFERGQIERLGLARVALEEVRSDPEGAASQALQLLANRSDHYAIHLDVDVVDFTDAPLSEHPSRNTGLKLDEMLRALRSLPRVLVWSRSPSLSSIPTTPRPGTGGQRWSSALSCLAGEAPVIGIVWRAGWAAAGPFAWSGDGARW